MVINDAELVFGELEYERRIVLFYDLLGWRSEVHGAGTDPRKVARLASVVRMFNAQIASARRQLPGAHLTSFSDNVVFSTPYDPGQLLWTLQGAATVQFGLAVQGFWLRGGVTVGDLYHDEFVVFGPGLVRAHHLESTVATYPRILVDPEIGVDVGETDFLATEADETFIDPFNVEFYDRIQSEHPVDPQTIANFNQQSGLQIPTRPIVIPGEIALGAVAARIEHELRTAECPRVFDKHRWWFDRIATRLNLPFRSDAFSRPG